MVSPLSPREIVIRESDSQEKPTRQRVREEGASEGRPVMGRIGVASSVNITPPARAQTSLWSFVTRESWPTDSGRQADMSAAEMPAGAAPDQTPDWHSIDWSKVWRTVRRLQARIAATRCIFSICNALCKGGLLTLPDVPPSVCYPSGRHRQRRGPKPGGQRNLTLPGWSDIP